MRRVNAPCGPAMRLSLFQRVFRGNAGDVIFTFGRHDELVAEMFAQCDNMAEPEEIKQLRLFNATCAGQWELLKVAAGIDWDHTLASRTLSKWDLIVDIRAAVVMPVPRPVLPLHDYYDHRWLTLSDFNFMCYLMDDEVSCFDV